MTVTLFSEEFCDEVKVQKSYYKEFVEDFSTKTHFEEIKTNDIIYFAYLIYDELNCNIAKRNLLLFLADLAQAIQVDEIIQLKNYQLERLLKSNEDNYLTVYRELISDTQ
jgi:hypothetical protein